MPFTFGLQVKTLSIPDLSRHFRLFLVTFILSLFLHLSFLIPQGKIMKGVYRFHAVITTFEMILADCPELRSVPWRCVVIDEAHRLKNRNCKLLEGLKMMDMVSVNYGYGSSRIYVVFKKNRHSGG